MSFAIKQGLFKLNITDSHAILGVSIDAESKEIRLKYLKIAQKLHPDKCRKEPEKAKLAGQILSKLVNPAYEQLSRKGGFAEQQLVLTQIGKRLAQNKAKVQVKSEVAQELLKTSSNVELVYPKLLKKLTVEQYMSLDCAMENIAAISELNMVYLMLKCERMSDSSLQASNKPASQPTASTKQTAKKQTKQSKNAISQATTSTSETDANQEEPSSESRVNAFVSRAQQYISKAEFERAIAELKDALRIDPNNALAHAVIGRAYLHSKQLTMAKVHINRAYKLDPHNITVVEIKKALDRQTRKSGKSRTVQPKSENKSPNSGFFSGFFGSKKK